MNTRMTGFDFERPAGLPALRGLLARLGKEQRSFTLAAGGTDLLPQLKQRQLAPQVVVSLNGVGELTGIELTADGTLRIGALTRLAEVAEHALVRQQQPALAAVAARVASPQIRNRATLGGNLLVNNRCIYVNQGPLNRAVHAPCFKVDGDVCHIVKSAVRGKLPQCQARFVSDTAPVLLLLDARLVLLRGRGERRVPLRRFYRNDGIERNVLKPGEVLGWIEVPPAGGLRVDYDKLAVRNALDFPSLGVAVGVRENDSGEPVELAVALTGLGTYPLHWRFELVAGITPPAVVAQACAKAGKAVTSYQQDFFPRDYRKKMIGVFIHRALRRLGREAWV